MAGSAGGTLSVFDRVWSRIEDALNLLSALVIFALMLFVLAEVVLRTAFNASMHGFIDIVEQSMAVFAFLGAAYCQRLGGHIRMEAAVANLRGRPLWLTEVVGTIVALLIITLLIQGSWAHFLRAYSIGDTTIDAQLITWPSKLMAPFGLSVLWLRLALQLAGYVRLSLRPALTPLAVPPAHDHRRPPVEE